MATITISGNASVVLDGKTLATSDSFTAEVDDVSEYTTHVYAAYIPISPASTKNAFYVVVNNGTADAVLRLTIGATFSFFPIPVGGHIVIPAAGRTDTGTAVAAFTAAHAGAVTGFTRLYVMVGHHA